MLKEMVARFKVRRNYSTSSSFEVNNPEVFRMLDRMAEKNSEQKQVSNKKDGGKAREAIVLSDSEFGKY